MIWSPSSALLRVKTLANPAPGTSKARLAARGQEQGVVRQGLTVLENYAFIGGVNPGNPLPQAKFDVSFPVKCLRPEGQRRSLQVAGQVPFTQTGTVVWPAGFLGVPGTRPCKPPCRNFWAAALPAAPPPRMTKSRESA